ncbi:glycoside hydrolase family 25 protein [Butyrivibrio sp. FCS014]|uniref:glycoside hydrolase family 25 protein n=1 Tax=Butyrivibrio sp. FCS014 TaxID=1408304 RepID=UPI000462F3AA|nr:glycoside hydrolase family 25 protein [Butyrivibrio sp. FCS014]
MDNRLIKIMLGVIGALAILVVAGAFIRLSKNDKEEVNNEESIFEDVSTLEALNMGLIDGDELLAEEGIEKKEEDPASSASTEDRAAALLSLLNEGQHIEDTSQFVKIDVKDKVVTESQINVAEEDTKVADVDETTEVSEEDYSEEDTFDDWTEEDEDLLAQIESEVAEEERQKALAEKAASEAPNITQTAEYESAHAGTKGIDVSKHNGNIDWGQVKASGISFAMVRCGYRGSSSGVLVVDPMYQTNMNGAINAGLGVGVYFFSQAVNVQEAVEEASMVLDLLNGYSLSYPVYLDVEKSNGRGDAISPEERTEICRAFLATISNAGYTAGIYSNKLWFENRINTGSLTDYKIWMAQYVDIPTYAATRYDMWQYTSKGSVPGVPGNCDMNVLK